MDKFTEILLEVVPNNINTRLTSKGAQLATAHLSEEILGRLGEPGDTRSYIYYVAVVKLWDLLGYDYDKVREIAGQYEDQNDPPIFRISFDKEAMRKLVRENRKLKVVKGG